MAGMEWAIGLFMLTAILLRAWLWCRESQRDDEI
jgi:hypothetical protein